MGVSSLIRSQTGGLCQTLYRADSRSRRSPHRLKEALNYSLKQAVNNTASPSLPTSCIALPPAILVSLFATCQALSGLRAFAPAVISISNTLSLFFLWLLPRWALYPSLLLRRAFSHRHVSSCRGSWGAVLACGGHGCKDTGSLVWFPQGPGMEPRTSPFPFEPQMSPNGSNPHRTVRFQRDTGGNPPADRPGPGCPQGTQEVLSTAEVVAPVSQDACPLSARRHPALHSSGRARPSPLQGAGQTKGKQSEGLKDLRSLHRQWPCQQVPLILTSPLSLCLITFSEASRVQLPCVRGAEASLPSLTRLSLPPGA